MCHVLRAGTQIADRNDLCKGVDGQPEPEHVLRAAQPGAQFIQLEVRKLEVGEAAPMQDLRVLASAGQPGGDSGMPIAEDPLSGRRVQPTSRAQSTPLLCDERGFSDGTRGCRAGQ
jgi:hypothetical protein